MLQHAQIFPLEISEVIGMNKEVVKHTATDGASQKCHGCEEVKEGLDKCGGCTLFYYCSKVSRIRAVHLSARTQLDVGFRC